MTTTLLMLALKSLLVAAATLGILRLARNRSAAERSTIAHLGLFALVALPLASLTLPPLSIALPEFAAPAPAAAPAVQPLAAEPIAPAAWTAPPVTIDETPAVAPVTQQTAPTASTLGQSPSMAEIAAPLARYAYALPAAALLLLTLVALMRLVALRSRAQVLIDPRWLGALGRAQHRMGFKSGTALLTSTELRSPISWGLLRPTIVVNEDALASAEQAEAIIAHELAHVIQLDWAKLMLARVATAAFWFNPLAWVLAREAHQLREEAADDAVLAADIAGTDYAQLLVGIARHENRGLLLGAHGVAPGRDLLRRRVARVLDKTPARGPSGRSWVAGFTAGMMVMAAPLAAVTFGTARAEDKPSKPVAQAEPAPTSWSTRAGEAPNQLISSAPRHFFRDHGAALANAVGTLHDDAPDAWAGDSSRSITPPDADLTPGTPEFSSAWAQYGSEIGEHFSRAFSMVPAVPALPARPAPVVRVAPHAAPEPNFDFNFDYPDFAARFEGKNYSESDLDGMAGFGQAYRKEMADAGFPNATRGELAQARSLGLTDNGIAELRTAGVTGSLRNFGQAQATGLTGDYMRSLRAAGLNGSISDFNRAKAVGLTGDYVRTLSEAGVTGSFSDYIRAKASGLPSGYVSNLMAEGISASLNDYIQLRNLGITSSYVRALHDHGTDITDPLRLIELKTRGYRPKDRDDDD